MSREEILAYLSSDWTRVMNYMDGALSTDVRLLDSVNNSIRSHSGKMLRPIVALLMAKACGQPNDDTYRYAAAIELLHNATLLHDDVADESSERRGLPTVSSLLGPSAAVLVGDFWLSKAVELVFGASSYSEVVGLFSKSLTSLAEGEMIQLEKASSADTQESDYYRIVECKTATLFYASTVSAMKSIKASGEMVRAAKDYGTSLGIAFQIKDDILDYVGTDVLGKPTGVDLKEKKITLPLLGALKNSPREAEIRSMIMDMDAHPEYQDEIRSFVMDNGGLDYAAECLEKFIGKAKAALGDIEDSAAKDYLVSIVEYNTLRNI